MKRKLNENGITLISLVVTIIVLIILAAVSISLVLGENGLIQRTQKAGENWEKAQEEEQTGLNSLQDEIDNAINAGNAGGTSLASVVSIGDYVAYSPDSVTITSETQIIKDLASYSGYTGTSYNTESQITQESLKWRVLDIVDGQVVLISEKPTSHTVYLSGANGYNNAVKLLDDLCNTLYSKSGVTTEARSLKIEDIQDKITYDYTSYVGPYQYGTTNTYTMRYYPNIFANEKRGWVDSNTEGTADLSEQTAYIDGSTRAGTSITVTQTYWNKSMVASDFKDYSTNDNMYYKLFINSGTGNYNGYWLSSRCVVAGLSSANFYVRLVDSGSVDAIYLYYSSAGTFDCNICVRPVVALSSGVQVDGTNAEGAWNIK